MKISLPLRNNALAANAGWMLAGQGISIVAQAVYFLLIARVLGSAEYGIFVGSFALVSAFGSFSAFGSGMLIVRYVSANHEAYSEYWGNCILSVALSGVLCVSVISLVGPHLLHTQASGMLFMIAAADCIFAKLTDCAGRAFQAFEQLRITATFVSVTSILRLVAAFLLWTTLHRATAKEWAGAYFAVSFLVAAYATVSCIARLGMPRFRLGLLVQRFWEGIGFCFAGSTTAIYDDADKAMLTHYGQYAASGAYSAAYKILDVATLPIRSLHVAAFPRFFKAGVEGPSSTLAMACRILRRTILYALGAAIAMWALAPLLPMLVGKSFNDSTSVLRWLCLLPAIRSLHLSAGDAITGAGYQRFRTSSQFIVAGLNFALNLYLIPAFSWRGAAWSTLMTDGLLAIGNWTLLLWLQRGQTTVENVCSSPFFESEG